MNYAKLLAVGACAFGASLMGCASDTSVETASTQGALTVSGNTVSGQITRTGSLDLSMDFQCERTARTLTWTGSVLFDHVDAQLRLQNNTKGTHTTTAEDVFATVEVAPDEPITINKKDADEHWSMGNPYIYFQPYRGSQALGSPILLGRCNGNLGRFKKHYDFTFLSQLLLSVHPVDNNSCTRDSDQIFIDGTLEAVGEISGKVWFVQNKEHFSDKLNADLNVTFSVDADNLVFNKSPHYGGAGGNPLVYVRLTEPVTTDWYKLGRCNKL